MAYVKCAYDGEVLHADEAVREAIQGRGELTFCGEDCANLYRAKLRKEAPHIPPPPPPSDHEDRLTKVESTLEEILRLLKEKAK